MTGLRVGVSHRTEILYALQVATESVYLRIQCCPAGGSAALRQADSDVGTYEAVLMSVGNI